MPTFFDHLAELRSRLLLCIAAVVLGAGIAHVYHEAIIALLLHPIHGQNLVFLSPLEPLLFVLKVDLFAGVILALPVITWSVLAFLRPAMRRTSWLVFCSIFCLTSVLLVAGLIYAYFVVVPLTMHFLTSISIAGIGNMMTANSYFSFLILQLVLMAALFQIPLLILAGVAIGAFNPTTLAKKRRYIYVGGLIVLAVITPTTDLFSLGCVAIPALIIFEGSLLASRMLLIFRRNKKASSAE